MSKYLKDVTHLKTLDPYRLQELYQMHPCAEHVVKKMLVAGERSGGKTLDEDISDCIWTLQRWQEMRKEDKIGIYPGLDATHGESDGQEFVSRYDWGSAKAWAEFAATDLDGSVFWYAEKPHIDEAARSWNIFGDGRYFCVSRETSMTCDEWRDTLEARPQ